MIDFSLAFIDTPGHFLVGVNGPEIGETPEPLPPTSKKRLFLRAAAARAAMAPFSAPEALAEAGRELFDELIRGANRELYRRAREKAEGKHELLRVLVRMPPESNLATVPFEAMHDGRTFLAQAAGIAVVRYLESDRELPAIAIAPPLRVLFTAARPAGHPAIDVQAEENALAKAYAPLGERVEITPYPKLTRLALEEIFRGGRHGEAAFHVWHHCGHGGLVDGTHGREFRLYLEAGGDDGYVTTEQLRAMVGVENQLRVAVFAVCHGGVLGGPAPELARLSVPAVIGFPIKVEARSIARFSEVLHSHLALSPVEQAVSEAQTALFAHDPASREWAHAYLFSRRRDAGPLLVQPVNSEGTPAAQDCSRQHRSGGVTVEQLVEDNHGIDDLDLHGAKGVPACEPPRLEVKQTLRGNSAKRVSMKGVDFSQPPCSSKTPRTKK